MKKLCSLFVFLLLLGQFTVNGQGQGYSNKGKDFYLTYPIHIDGNTSVMGIYITSDVNATGTITVGTQTLPFTVTANNVTKKFIGSLASNACPTCDASSTSVYLSQDEGITTGGAIHVVADNPVVVYAHIIKSARSGATLALPTNVWGNQYMVPSYKNVGSQSGSAYGYGTITVVAAEANTTFQITPAVDSKNLQHLANQPFTITLANPGDVYQIQFKQSADISGTIVKSYASGTGGCKKIAVFSSTSWSAFGCSGAGSGDNLYQQLFPTGSWGKNFLTAAAKTRQLDIFRVFVTDPTTVVQKTENGIVSTFPLTSLVNNSFYEYTTGSPTYIQTDKPSSVVQYFTTMTCQSGATIGDPEMIVLNPVEQTINNITVFSAHKNFVPSGQSSITNCYLNVIIKTNSVSSFRINGKVPTSNFTAIPATSYSFLQEEVTSTAQTNPVQTLSADSSFSAMAYGFGNVESYGYNAGTNVRDFTQVASFQNPYQRIDSAVTCANTQVLFGIPLNFQPTSIKWDFSAAPNIVPNAQVIPASPVLDSIRNYNGQSLYYYSPEQSYTFSNANTAALRDTIKLYTTSSTPDGCGSTDQVYSIPVVVKAKPAAANFTLSFSGCLSDSVRLTDQTLNTDGSLVKWLWDFGDGSSQILTSSQSVAKLYGATGNYTIKLKVSNDIGCASDSMMQPIQISSKPVAAFTAPAVVCENSNISFTDASTIQSGTIAKWVWNFDNGAGADTVSTNAAQTVQYPAFGPRDVRLMVQSSTGCKSDTFRLSQGFVVNAVPAPGFIIPEVCLNDASAVFTDSTKVADGSTNLIYAWNFNAGSPAVSPAPTVTAPALTAKNPSVKYNKAADYQVSLTVNSNGCVASVSENFTVNGANPTPAFQVINASGLCSFDSVKIQNKSTVDFGVVTRLVVYWDATDTTLKTIDENPYPDKFYSYKYPGLQVTKNYTVTLRAFSGNAASCSKSVSQVVTVNANPKVSFVTMPGICNEAAARQITQATYDPIVSGSFAYAGTGVSLSGLFNPQAAGVGTFPIKFTYTSNKGCIDTATKTITVWPSPSAVWAVTGNTCQKRDIFFTDSSIANYSNIIQRKWNYGNGTTAIRTNNLGYTNQFDTAGTYRISLQVFTDSGCQSQVNVQSIKVNYLPIVNFSLPGICLPDGRGQFFNQSLIADSSMLLFSYLWSFNDPADPTSSTLKDPVHKYSATGPYNVQLRVTSKDGCVDSLTQILSTIYPQPKASFSATPAEICVNDVINFTDLSTGAVSWAWDLAGGTSSNLQNPVKKFTDSGFYNIQFWFFDSKGCVSDTATKQVSVYAYPVLVMGPMLKVLEGGVVTVKPQFVYGTGLSYLWTPSLYLDNDTAALPKSTPLNDITYHLLLTGKAGCSVTDTIFVQILRSPEVPNAFSPNGDGINDTWQIKYLESYPGAVIEVYNRYGQLVFHSVGYDKNWDGTYNGNALPVGTYYYIINPKNGRPLMQGSVTLIK